MFLRFLLLSLLLIQLSGCGTQKLRFVNVDPKPVTKELAILHKKPSVSVTKDAINVSKKPMQQTAEITPLAQSDAFSNEEEIVSFHEPTVPEPTDSTNIVPDDIKVSEALKTEHKAKISKGLSIASIALFLFLGPLFLITAIIAWIMYRKAKLARYNTELGERHLANAKIALIINAVLFSIAILLLIIIVLFLVFIL